MREIKFRGLTKEGQWKKGSLILSHDNSRAFIGYIELLDEGRVTVVHYEEVLRETVGQYTDLKDKNGNEIYEGDVIKLSCGCCIYQIEYNKHAAAFFPRDDGFSRIHANHVNVWEHECTVIGNIHQNRELLEAKP